MSVVLFSGGLARFFLGDWTCAPATVLTDDEEDGNDLDEGDDAPPDDAGDQATPSDVQSYFEGFAAALAKALRPMLAADLRWSEALTGPYEAVALGERQLGALMIIVARAAVRNKRLTPASMDRPWTDDPAVQEIQDAEADFQPVHHLVKADGWLPASFLPVVETEVPERDLILGSLTELSVALAEAGRLVNTPNETTRKLAPSLVEEARRAHAMFVRVVAHASAHGLPMLIDRFAK